MTQEEFIQLSVISEGLKKHIPVEQDAGKRVEMEQDLKEINRLLLPELLHQYGSALSQKAA